MHAIPFLPRLLQRCRMPLAVLFGFTSLVLLWTGLGLSELLPRPGVAVAESLPPDHRIAPAALPRERADLLQSSVDSVALSLGSAFAVSSSLDEEEKRQMLGFALSGLTFGLGGEVYFTAWQGTRVIHSPLSPDAADMDFAEALDERGAAFVRSMESVAGEGGFIQVTLPRQFAGQSLARTPLLRNLDDAEITRALEMLVGDLEKGADTPRTGPVALRGPIKMQMNPLEPAEVVAFEPEPCLLRESCGQGLLCLENPTLARPGLPVFSSAPVEQVVYVRRIPHSAWYIAAFMPLAVAPGMEGGFSSAWSSENLVGSMAAENMFRRGLSLSGLSLAGLAGLMLSPGNRRNGKEEEACTASSEPPRNDKDRL